jgi:hypothetical protein
MLSELVDMDDIGVLQTGGRFDLNTEAAASLLIGRHLGQEHFQGGEPVRLRLAYLVDDAHPAPAQLSKDLVAFDEQP